MHGVRRELVEQQAKQIGVALHPLLLPDEITMDEYDQYMLKMLRPFKRRGIEYGVFGDIFLENLRRYREKQLKKVNMKALFPLWEISTTRLAGEFIDAGFKAIVICVNGNKLDPAFLGRQYDEQFLEDLPEDVDPCGEYGEFHTFVYGGPIFKQDICYKTGEVVERSYPVADQADHTHSFSDHSDQEGKISHRFIDLIPG